MNIRSCLTCRNRNGPLDKYCSEYYYVYMFEYIWRYHMLLYLKSHRRRPVYWGPPHPRFDRQGAIPAGWCYRCGVEVFEPGEMLCLWCRASKGEIG